MGGAARARSKRRSAPQATPCGSALVGAAGASGRAPLGVGEAIALLGIGVLLATVIVVRWFSETARHELDETSVERA